MAKNNDPIRSDTEIREILLRYFYDRNRNAKSARSDKSGAAAKISVIRRDLMASHSLKQQEVRSNLTYLISEGWVEEEQVTKTVPLKSGTVIPQATSYFRITARGIDKIDGPGAFTMPKFHGIKIEASDSIVTVGDGNQVDARFEKAGNDLASFKDTVRECGEIDDSIKRTILADVDSVQSQLAKPEPNRSVLSMLWEGIERLTTGTSLAASVAALTGLLQLAG